LNPRKFAVDYRVDVPIVCVDAFQFAEPMLCFNNHHRNDHRNNHRTVDRK